MTNLTNNGKVFKAMEDDSILSRTRTFTIVHPKKDGYATISIVYPKDGAGRLKAFCIDSFGDSRIAQSGYAGGYGYDKAGAAMSGFVIDGKTITDHCGQDVTSAKLLKAYGKAIKISEVEAAKVVQKAKKLGYSFANWTSGGGYHPNDWDGYQSCYKDQGLDYLRTLGYRVIQAN